MQFERTGNIGVTARADLRAVGEAAAAEIRAAVHQHAFVVFRGQQLTAPEYIAFARSLGTIEAYLQENYHHPDHPEIFVSSNEVREGKKFGVAKTGNYWHTDQQFLPRPLPFTLLYPQKLPDAKRETLFVDMGRVLEALPAALREKVEKLDGVHEGKWRYKVREADVGRSLAEIVADIDRVAPPVRHPAVFAHPVTGRRLLYVSPGFTTGLAGLPHEDAQRTLAELLELSTRPEQVLAHEWQPGDIAVWDNRQLLHRSGQIPEGQVSTHYRIGVHDGVPFYAGATR
jgi:taurine dioxygenase